MRTAVLKIQGVPPSPNLLSGRRWQVVRGGPHSVREQWAALALAAALEARRLGNWDGRMFQRCAVIVVAHWPDRRRRDLDNLAAGMKWSFDRLSGLLWPDDNPSHIAALTVLAGEPDRVSPHVTVIVVEVPDALVRPTGDAVVSGEGVGRQAGGRAVVRGGTIRPGTRDRGPSKRAGV